MQFSSLILFLPPHLFPQSKKRKKEEKTLKSMSEFLKKKNLQVANFSVNYIVGFFLPALLCQTDWQQVKVPVTWKDRLLQIRLS